MIRRFLRPGLAAVILASLASGSALAAPARIMSGEHDGFTRLVVIFDTPVDWVLGRTPDGYALRIAGDAPDYDLTGAFNLIGRTRLATLAANPETGDLNIGFACACHAEPFEFRAGTIVIDLKDGPPAPDAPYEEPLEPSVAAPKLTALDPVSPPDPLARRLSLAWAENATKYSGQPGGTEAPFAGIEGFAPGDAVLPSDPGADSGEKPDVPDTDLEPEPEPELEPVEAGDASDSGATPALAGDPFNPVPQLPAAVSTIDPALAALRDDLVRELSRGASAGVVDLALPNLAAPEEGEPPAQADIALEDLRLAPRLNIGGPEDGPGNLTAEGETCADDTQLDLASWLDDRPVMDQIAEARSHLTGEFDRPDPEALRKAVRFHLAIGFGAEAIHLTRAFKMFDEDRALWDSLGYIMDQRADPAPHFAGMAACDGSAALWALLSGDSPIPDQPWNIPAIQRGFSALPPVQRKILGPRVVEALHAIGADDASRSVRNAMERAGGEKTPAEQLMEGEIALQEGDHAEAEEVLEPLATSAGPNSAEALVALVESRAGQGLPISPDVPIQIEALASERRGTAEEPRFRRAQALAHALSGDFVTAFGEAAAFGELAPDLWRLLAALGSDEDVLALAVLEPGTPAPTGQPEIALALSGRLHGLGLPDPARLWYEASGGLDPVLGARIALDRHDGLAALLSLQGAQGPEAERLRAAAQDMVGNSAEAATILTSLGEVEAAAGALARSRAWETLAQTVDPNGAPDAAPPDGTRAPLWQTAVARLGRPGSAATEPQGAGQDPGTEAGPLAMAAELARESEATRTELQALLDAVPRPAAP